MCEYIGTVYISRATKCLHDLYMSETNEPVPGNAKMLLSFVTRGVTSLDNPILDLKEVINHDEKALRFIDGRLDISHEVISETRKKIRSTTYTGMLAMAKDLCTKLLHRVVGDRTDHMAVESWEDVQQLFNNNNTYMLAWIQLVQASRNKIGNSIYCQTLQAGEENDWSSAAYAVNRCDIPHSCIEEIKRVNNRLFGPEQLTPRNKRAADPDATDQAPAAKKQRRVRVKPISHYCYC